MAKLTLDLESNALEVFGRMTSGMDEIRSEVNLFSKDGKESFKKVTDEAEKLTDEVKRGGETTKKFHEENGKLAKTGNIYRELKKQVKEYETQAYAAAQAGNKAFGDELLKKAGKLKDQIADMNAETKALTGNIGENLARAGASSIGLITTGYEGALSAQVLLGDKSKEFEQTLLRLQALNGIARVAQEFAGIGDKIREIQLGFKPVVDLFTNGASSIVDGYSSANTSLVGFFSNFKDNAKAAFSSANTFIKDFGKNTVSVAKSAATGFVSFFSNFGANMKTFAKSAKAGIDSVGAAIKANPLGVILTVVALVIGAMVALRDKVKPIAELFEYLGKLIDSAADALESLGQAMGIVSSEYEKQTKAIVDGTQKQLEAIGKRYDAEIAIAQAAGGNTVEIEKKKQKALLDRVIQSISLLRAKKVIEGKISEEELEQFKELEKQRKEIVLEGVLVNVRAQKEEADKKKELEKQKADLAKAAADKRLQLEKDLQASLLDLLKRSQSAEIDLLNGEEKIAKQKELAELELKNLRDLIMKKGLLTDRNFKFTAEQESQFGILQTQINQKFANDIIAIEIEKANRLAALRSDQAGDDLKFYELQAKLKIAAVQNTKTPDGVSEELFELEKQRNILQIQKQSAEEQLAFKVSILKAEADAQVTANENEILALVGKTDELSNIKRQQAETNIAQTKANLQLETDVLIAETEVQINALGKEIEKTTDKINSKGKLIDWQKLLGLDDKEFELLKKASADFKAELQSLSDASFGIANQQLDKELSLLDKRIEIRDKDIADLQDRLDKEQELAEQGLAHNSDNLKRELADKEAQRQKDLAKQKEIFEKKKKLAYAQFAIDTAIQASNLVTAVSEVFVTYAAAPYVAAALAALMVASFAVTKVAAFNAIKNDTGGFKDGVIDLQGPGTKTSDSIPAWLSKGESVMTADETQEHYDLLMGIRNKDNKLIELGIRNLLENTGVSLPSDAPAELSRMKSDARSSELRILMPAKDVEHTRMMQGIKERVEMIEMRGRTKTYTNSNGDTVIESGNNVRIIKKR